MSEGDAGPLRVVVVNPSKRKMTKAKRRKRKNPSAATKANPAKARRRRVRKNPSRVSAVARKNPSRRHHRRVRRRNPSTIVLPSVIGALTGGVAAVSAETLISMTGWSPLDPRITGILGAEAAGLAYLGGKKNPLYGVAMGSGAGAIASVYALAYIRNLASKTGQAIDKAASGKEGAPVGRPADPPAQLSGFSEVGDSDIRSRLFFAAPAQMQGVELDETEAFLWKYRGV